jgi:DNA-binding MarR family transcriptional regulator
MERARVGLAIKPCRETVVNMPEGSWETRLAAELADAGEAFVLAWSSMPPDLPERISTSQLRALIAIRAGEGTTVTDLARALDALPSSATRLCDRLTAAGYIERTANPANRRFHSLSLTPHGAQLLETLDGHREEVLAATLDRMPPRARQQLAEGLAAFAAQASQGRPLREADRRTG